MSEAFNQTLAKQASATRDAKVNAETAETLHALAACIESMATAMDEDDSILGSLAGQGIANYLSALPSHVREVFIEYLSDEAAAGYRADQRYWEWQASQGVLEEPPA